MRITHWTEKVLVILFMTMSMISYGFAAEKLKIVSTEKVCMVTNMVFPKAQIPVSHGGKTYYGCCENCKKTLSEDPKARMAIDPVTGRSVDKATAVIAAGSDGSVVYFESQKSLEKFNSGRQR